MRRDRDAEGVEGCGVWGGVPIPIGGRKKGPCGCAPSPENYYFWAFKLIDFREI